MHDYFETLAGQTFLKGYQASHVTRRFRSYVFLKYTGKFLLGVEKKRKSADGSRQENGENVSRLLMRQRETNSIQGPLCRKEYKELIKTWNCYTQDSPSKT